MPCLIAPKHASSTLPYPHVPTLKHDSEAQQARLGNAHDHLPRDMPGMLLVILTVPKPSVKCYYKVLSAAACSRCIQSSNQAQAVTQKRTKDTTASQLPLTCINNTICWGFEQPIAVLFLRIHVIRQPIFMNNKSLCKSVCRAVQRAD